MKLRQDLAGNLWKGGMLAVMAVLASAGIALGSNAVRGAAYIGHYAGGATEAISFKVSANGTKVTALFVDTPIKCSGGCGGIPSASGGSARIGRKGKFTVTMKLKALGSSTKVIGTDTVTGTFLRHGLAKGSVTSHFNSGGGGRTTGWTATG
jgi:hypothetical protein